MYLYMPKILLTEEEKKLRKHNYNMRPDVVERRKNPNNVYPSRVLLTEEEKKLRIHNYNTRPDITWKRMEKNNTQFFCDGCQRNYGYTHKKDHFTGSTHKYYMKMLKDKNENHVEQHQHK